MADFERVPVRDNLKMAIDAAVREAMPNLAVRTVEVFAGEDYDGDPALFVEISHDFTRNPVDPKALSALVEKLRTALGEFGEFRFPLIRHHFAENQKVVGYS
jgi:hypothetical protein